MLTSSEASDPGAGPSSSPDYSHPPHRHQSSPDLVTSNKRPLEDSDQGPSNLKIRRSSPEQAARDYDDIDRKISMAGNNHIYHNNNSTVVVIIVITLILYCKYLPSNRFEYQKFQSTSEIPEIWSKRDFSLNLNHHILRKGSTSSYEFI